MDIFATIKKDHREVQKLLKELTETQERAVKKRPALLQKIREELLPHNKAEEKVFYPLLESNRERRLMKYEGFDEHELGTQVLMELMRMNVDSEEWAAKAKVLKDLIDHHIKEEEGNMHPEAKKVLTKEEAKSLAIEFENLKEDFKGHLESEALRAAS